MNVRLQRSYTLLVLLGALFAACEFLDPEPELIDVVAALNANCPVMVDSETRLDEISTDGRNSLSYHYSLVNVQAGRVDTHQFRLAMWPGLLSMIRLSPDMEKLRRDHVTIRYYYQDKDAVPIVFFEFRPEHYLSEER